MQFNTILDVHNFYKNGGKITDVINYFQNNINNNPQIGAVIRQNLDFTQNEIQELINKTSGQNWDEIIRKFPLFGIPYMMKDNVLIEGLQMQAASQILKGYESTYSADIYHFLKNAGAILLAQVNMDELAFGSSSEYSSYEIKTKNPYDLDRVPGGSSGGSAAAVAANLAIFSIGTDTGGSVRQPASFTNLVGVRPSYGTVSRFGMVAAASSFDQAGVFTKNVEDNQKILKILQSPSKNDATWRAYQNNNNQIIKIGLPTEFFQEGLDKEIKNIIEQKIEILKNQGFQIETVSLPSTKYSIPTYYLLMAVEASSNLERLDGVRYANLENTEIFHEFRKLGFGKEAKRRIMLGTFASSAGYYDAYYNTALKMREKIKEEYNQVFQKVDVLLTPTSPIPAFKIGEKMKSDPTEMYLADIMTLSPALAANASISVPAGFMQKDGKNLPVGIQIIANIGQEEKMYKMAKIIENLNN